MGRPAGDRPDPGHLRGDGGPLPARARAGRPGGGRAAAARAAGIARLARGTGKGRRGHRRRLRLFPAGGGPAARRRGDWPGHRDGRSQLACGHPGQVLRHSVRGRRGGRLRRAATGRPARARRKAGPGGDQSRPPHHRGVPPRPPAVGRAAAEHDRAARPACDHPGRGHRRPAGQHRRAWDRSPEPSTSVRKASGCFEPSSCTSIGPTCPARRSSSGTPVRPWRRWTAGRRRFAPWISAGTSCRRR